MKELAKDTYDLYLLEREILIMKDLKHPGLIGLKEVRKRENECCAHL